MGARQFRLTKSDSLGGGGSARTRALARKYRHGEQGEGPSNTRKPPGDPLVVTARFSRLAEPARTAAWLHAKGHGEESGESGDKTTRRVWSTPPPSRLAYEKTEV